MADGAMHITRHDASDVTAEVPARDVTAAAPLNRQQRRAVECQDRKVKVGDALELC